MHKLLYSNLLLILASFLVGLVFQLLKLDIISTAPILGVLLSTVGIFFLSALTAKLLSIIPLTKKLV